MTDKELRKLKRAELIKLFLLQSKENDRLREELADANKRLEDRRILLENTGSIAEAALTVNHVFACAQDAAEQYLENIRLLHEQTEAECARLEQESVERANALMRETEQRCRELLRRAQSPEQTEGETDGTKK